MSKKEFFNDQIRPFFGEVVESSMAQVVIELWKAVESPSFGSIVEIVCPWGSVYSVVYAFSDGIIDGGGRPVQAFGVELERLEVEQPHLFKLKTTKFFTKPFAYRFNASDEIFFGAMPNPIPLHGSARLLSDNLFSKIVCQKFFFFKLLSLFDDSFFIDNLAGFIVSKMKKDGLVGNNFIDEFYDQYSRLPGFDVSRARGLFSIFEHIL